MTHALLTLTTIHLQKYRLCHVTMLDVELRLSGDYWVSGDFLVIELGMLRPVNIGEASITVLWPQLGEASPASIVRIMFTQMSSRGCGLNMSDEWRLSVSSGRDNNQFIIPVFIHEGQCDDIAGLPGVPGKGLTSGFVKCLSLLSDSLLGDYLEVS